MTVGFSKGLVNRFTRGILRLRIVSTYHFVLEDLNGKVIFGSFPASNSAKIHMRVCLNLHNLLHMAPENHVRICFLNVETFVIAAWRLQRAALEEDGIHFNTSQTLCQLIDFLKSILSELSQIGYPRISFWNSP